MTAFGLVGAKGAPGVTTSAVLLAAVWPRPACLLEADPAGGDVRWWQSGAGGLPLRPDTGVVSLLAARRAGRPSPQDMITHAQQIPGGLPVVVGVGSPSQYQALAPIWPTLVDLLTEQVGPCAAPPDELGSLDVVVDAGRLGNDPGAGQLLAALPVVLLVCRPTVASIGHARHALSALRSLPAVGRRAPRASGDRPHLGVVVIGSAGDRTEVRVALIGTGTERDHLGGRQVFFGHLADDPAAAAGLAGQWTRRLDRSPLVASGRRLAGDLHELLSRADPGPADADLPVASRVDAARPTDGIFATATAGDL